MLEVDDSRGAQRALNYLGVLGTAMLVSPDGNVALASGEADKDWLAPIAESVVACIEADGARAERVGSLVSAGSCTYFARVGAFGAIILLVEHRVAPARVIERFARVLAVFDRVGATPPGGAKGSPSGEPQEAQASQPRK